jgi:hypothetical protein
MNAKKKRATPPRLGNKSDAGSANDAEARRGQPSRRTDDSISVQSLASHMSIARLVHTNCCAGSVTW